MSVFACLFISCNKESADQAGARTEFGKLIDIPDILLDGTDGCMDLKSTNEGLYFSVFKGDQDEQWIYRLQPTGPSPSWQFHKADEYFQGWEPNKYLKEKPDEFSIYFHWQVKNGYIGMNSGTPNEISLNSPFVSGFGYPDLMLHDNSPSANHYAFFGRTVKKQRNTASTSWDILVTLPENIEFVESDPSEAVIWAAGASAIYKITVNGAVTKFDVSGYYTPDISWPFVQKIRFNYDPLHKDVYFKYMDKVFKIENGTKLSLFYTVKYKENTRGGDFTVDGGHLYATDGIKKNLAFLDETRYYPEMPETDDVAILTDYAEKSTIFEVGQLEVLKNITSQRLYCLTSNKLLEIAKTLR